MPSTQLSDQVTADVRALASGDLAEGATKLFRTLGYESTRLIPGGDDDSPAAFLERLQANVTDTQSEQEFRKEVSSVKLLFQVTDSEIQTASSLTADMFDSMADASDANITQSFFFAVAQLKGKTYPRGVYARVAREINKRLPLATVVLMRNDSNDVSLAFVDRREHRRQPGRAVLGNVALLREIDTKEPHRAHLDILSELVLKDRLAWIANNAKGSDFAGLLAAWLDVLNTEELNKRFYRGLYEWYQRAMKVAKFPTSDEPVEEQVIRLITRLMFVWFIKEKQFVARELFNEQQVSEMLKDYDAADGDSYYRCILQNLFFATLNTPVLDRKFTTDVGVKSDDNNASGFRYKYVDEIEQVEELRESFHNSPFVNGGLFDCLDEHDDAGGMINVVDCFRDKPEHIGLMSVPNRLFFDDKGIVTHFNRFKFTVEESTPLEQEVALDPELLGNVFESLLATYVPETSKSEKASKQARTGSYYTPRKVVDYMVDEALKESLLARVSDEFTASDYLEERILDLFDYGVTEQDFSDAEAQTLVRAIAETKILDPAVGSGAFPMAALHKLTLALRKLDPANDLWESHQRNLAMERTEEAFEADSKSDRDEMLEDISEVFETYRSSDYGRKLFLIQNCIFGVDIQPIAVQISKLRFFISLAIEQRRIDKGDENYGIRALPNLETRFVIADTLLPLQEPEQSTLGDSETIRSKLQTLMANRERHFRAYEPAEKDALRRTDDALRRDLAAHLQQRGMPETDADQLATWDPFNHSSVAQWFNAKFMFNALEGFDVVIGNPPYARLQNAGGLLADRYQPVGYETFSREGDIYQLFQEVALKLVPPTSGVVALITSNSWMRTEYGDGTRKVLGAEGRVLSLIELGEGVFPNAIVDTNTLIVTSATEARLRNRAVDVERSATGSFPPSAQDWGHLGQTDGLSWSPVSAEETRVLKTMLESGVQLKDWDVSINGGIKTGLNAAFVIPDTIRQDLIQEDERASEIIKPVLRGRDIHRYENDQSHWLIATHNGYDQYERVKIDDYPGVKHFLDGFGKLKSREDQGFTPYHLRDCAYYGHFGHERLIWKELSDAGSFTFESREIYCVNSAYIMTGRSLKYLCGVLNSSIVKWYKRHVSLNTGKGLSRWVKSVMNRIPIPEGSESDRLEITKIVDDILSVKAERADADTTELENAIDRIVYDLYGLTGSQVEVVEEAMR